MYLGLFSICVGIFSILVGLMEWNWYYQHPLVRLYARYFRKVELRLLHAIFGSIAVGLGVMLL